MCQVWRDILHVYYTENQLTLHPYANQVVAHEMLLHQQLQFTYMSYWHSST